MSKIKINAGTSSKVVRVFVPSLTGTGLTGLAYNTSGLTCYYIREGQSSTTAISLVTATLGTWTSGGFIVVDATNMPGTYEIGLPNAVLASGAQSVIVYLQGATNMAQVPLEIELDAVNYQSANDFITGINSLAPPALWNTLNIDGSGNVYGNLQSVLSHAVTVDANNVINVSPKYWAGGLIPSPNVTGVPKVDLVDILGTASAGTAGYVAPDWSAIHAPTSTQNLSGTTISTSQNINSVTGSVGSVTASVTIAAGGIDIVQLTAALRECLLRAYVVSTGTTTNPVTADNYATAGIYNNGTSSIAYYESATLGTPVYIWTDGSYYYMTTTTPGTSLPAGYFKTALNATTIGPYTAQGTATGTPTLVAHGNAILAGFQPETVNITGSLSGAVGSVTNPVLVSSGTGANQINLSSGNVAWFYALPQFTLTSNGTSGTVFTLPSSASTSSISYVNAEIMFISGTAGNVGLSHRIQAYTGTAMSPNYQVTTVNAFPVTPQSGDVCIIVARSE